LSDVVRKLGDLSEQCGRRCAQVEPVSVYGDIGSANVVPHQGLRPVGVDEGGLLEAKGGRVGQQLVYVVVVPAAGVSLVLHITDEATPTDRPPHKLRSGSRAAIAWRSRCRRVLLSRVG